MSGPALCQTIHVADRRPRMLDAHAELLAAAARALYGLVYTPDTAALGARIAALLREERIPRGPSVFVRLSLTPQGEERLALTGRSLYDGYALRSIHPEAVPLPYEIPFGAAHSTLCEEADRLADRLADRIVRGAVALCCDDEGRCLRAGGGALFALKGRTLLTAPAADPAASLREYLRLRTAGGASSPLAFASVERMLLLRAAPSARLDVREEAFTLRDLKRMDELFFVDHRGITAFSRVGETPYLSIVAERLAASMEALFPKK